MARWGRRKSYYFDDNSVFVKKEFKATYVPDIDAYTVSFPYHAGFIDALKKKIPDTKRAMDYNRERHPQYIWTITAEYFENFVLPLAKIIYSTEAFGGNVEFTVVDRATVESFNQGATLTTDVVSTDVLVERFHNLLEKAGLDLAKGTTSLKLAKKFYYRASMYFHPDQHPERATDMSELNYLWFNLKESYFKETQ